MKLSFKSRTMLSYSTIGLLLLLMGFLNYFFQNKIVVEYNSVISDKLPKMKITGMLIGYSKDSAIPIMVLPNFFEDKSKVRSLQKTFSKKVEKFEELIIQLDHMTLDTAEENAKKDIMTKWKSYNDFSIKAFDFAANGKGPEDKAKLEVTINDQVNGARLDLHDSIMQMAGLENDSAEARATAANDQASKTSKYMGFGVAGGFALALLLGWFFAHSMSKSISNITNEVAEISTQVAHASEGLSKSAQDLSSTAQQQASSIEETSASVNEMSSSVESNTKLAEYSNKVAEEVDSLTRETQRWMGELTDAMKAIFDSNQRIGKLAQIIEEIGNKTEVIDEIVFKTQLLSFNASVEAERAGEHGRGFAVVAQEVGNLAQMSGAAASEIEGIVKNSIREAEAVTNENRERVNKGEVLANETKKKLEHVMQRMAEIIISTNQIMIASKEQAAGINQISLAVENLNLSAQNTASSAEETASSSFQLSGQSETLMTLVGQMQMLIDGVRSTAELSEVDTQQGGTYSNQNQAAS